MPASRNPFFIRTAEQAESDDQFLNLFSLGVLDLLPEDGIWNRFLPIESAPGGGKSTLLRLFTPTVLTSVANARSRPEFRDLVKKLTEIDAIDANGVQLLGVLVNCKEDYSRLEYLTLDSAGHEGLFWALLHSRLALLTIRAVLQLTGHTYPSDVDVVRFEPRTEAVTRRADARVVTGRDLFDRAKATEQLIFDSLNSFIPRFPSLHEAPSLDNAFQLLNTHRILVNGHETTRHILVMFDDAHLLGVSQRKLLISELERHDQSAIASWMAMRLRAIEAPDLISESVRTGRERLNSVKFEGWGRSRVEKWLLDVGDRRAQRAQHDVSSFAACLADSLETEVDPSKLAAAAAAERDRSYTLARSYGELYLAWLASTDNEVVDLSPLNQAIRWAQLQILMERRIQKLQREFTFESLSPVDVNLAGQDTLEPATMFMSFRNDLPYFYGAQRVAQLASMNVDQFLSLSAALFDLLLNTGSLGRRRNRPLPPTYQNRLILVQSRDYVESLRRSLPYGQDVFNLVTAIAQLCREESLRPNVPITPGVTGISIQVSERDKLIDAALSSDSTDRRLLNALGSALAHNVLSLRVTDRQRDEDRAVFYLNRLVCPAFDLPLGFGGYKPQELSRLTEWVSTGQPSRQRRLGIGQSR